MNGDAELLRQFAEHGQQDAFTELVRRKIPLVYAAALRQVGGDSHLAQDVVQGVFLALACRARQLSHHAMLTGWLFTTTRNLAAKTIRTQRRWQRRELEAHTMTTLTRRDEIPWDQLRPVVDEAMHELGTIDREALLLRFFEGHTFAETGAQVGLAENAARMRVERALEKLRFRLAQRGITSTAAALGAALALQPAIAVPAGLVATASGFAIAGAAGSGSLSVVPALTLMSTAKITLGVVAVGLAFFAGLYFGGPRSAPAGPPGAAGTPTDATKTVASLRADNESLRGVADRLESDRAAAAADAAQAKARLASLEAQLQETTLSLDKFVLERKQRTMLNNIRQLAAARDQFLTQNRNTPTTSELIGTNKMIRELVPADGEDYASLDLSNKAALSVTSPNGLTVTYLTAPPAALRAPWARAVQSYQASHNGEQPTASALPALASFFENPKEGADYLEWLETQKAPPR